MNRQKYRELVDTLEIKAFLWHDPNHVLQMFPEVVNFLDLGPAASNLKDQISVKIERAEVKTKEKYNIWECKKEVKKEELPWAWINCMADRFLSYVINIINAIYRIDGEFELSWYDKGAIHIHFNLSDILRYSVFSELGLEDCNKVTLIFRPYVDQKTFKLFGRECTPPEVAHSEIDFWHFISFIAKGEIN